MRNTLLTLFLCFLMGFIYAQEKELIILHTNDTHCQIEPFTLKTDTNVGGFLRRDAYIRQIREQYANVLLLDAGDFSQGTPYFNVFKGYTEVKLMNAMRYDAASLGNHEFDNGSAALAKRVKYAKFPIVCANYEFYNKALSKAVKRHVIVQRDGLKIGIFGLLADLKPLVAPFVSEEVRYLDPIAEARKEVALLQKEGCNLIICLSHLGVAENTTNDFVLAENVPGIDLIVGGHSHEEFAEPRVVGNTHIYQLAGKGKCIGKISLLY